MRYLVWFLIAGGAVAVGYGGFVGWRDYQERPDDGVVTVQTIQELPQANKKEEREVAIELHNSTRSVARVVGLPLG